jgi:hypothetical protein
LPETNVNVAGVFSFPLTNSCELDIFFGFSLFIGCRGKRLFGVVLLRLARKSCIAFSSKLACNFKQSRFGIDIGLKTFCANI